MGIPFPFLYSVITMVAQHREVYPRILSEFMAGKKRGQTQNPSANPNSSANDYPEEWRLQVQIAMKRGWANGCGVLMELHTFQVAFAPLSDRPIV
jgi:hypothetical protein